MRLAVETAQHVLEKRRAWGSAAAFSTKVKPRASWPWRPKMRPRSANAWMIAVARENTLANPDRLPSSP